MKEPNKIPLDPSTPKAKEAKKYPLNSYIESIHDDLYIPTDLDKIHKTLDEASNENSENSN